jgi:hypothetical protein
MVFKMTSDLPHPPQNRGAISCSYSEGSKLAFSGALVAMPLVPGSIISSASVTIVSIRLPLAGPQQFRTVLLFSWPVSLV